MISFPFSTSGKRWLLKLNPPDRERLVDNEHFFMTMAKARPYGDQTLAMEFEGRKDNVKRRDFIAFGERHGVRRAAVEARLDRLCAEAKPFAKRFTELGYDTRVTRQLMTQFNKRLLELSDTR